MCLWSIQVADREHILLELLEFDLENDTQCHSDHLTVYLDEDRQIGGRKYGFVVVLPSASGCEVPCFLVTLFNRSILWWTTSISDSYCWFPQCNSAVCVWCKHHRCRICHPIQWCWQGLQFWWVESVRLISLVVVHLTLKSLQYKVPWKWHNNACKNLKIQACLMTVQCKCRICCAAVQYTHHHALHECLDHACLLCTWLACLHRPDDVVFEHCFIYMSVYPYSHVI